MDSPVHIQKSALCLFATYSFSSVVAHFTPKAFYYKDSGSQKCFVDVPAGKNEPDRTGDPLNKESGTA